jgi:hypothetical protein
LPNHFLNFANPPLVRRESNDRALAMVQNESQHRLDLSGVLDKIVEFSLPMDPDFNFTLSSARPPRLYGVRRLPKPRAASNT